MRALAAIQCYCIAKKQSNASAIYKCFITVKHYSFTAMSAVRCKRVVMRVDIAHSLSRRWLCSRRVLSQYVRYMRHAAFTAFLSRSRRFTTLPLAALSLSLSAHVLYLMRFRFAEQALSLSRARILWPKRSYIKCLRATPIDNIICIMLLYVRSTA